MSEQGVDLSQIRGDYWFHLNYLANAITQTIKRERRYLDSLKISDAEIAGAVQRREELWGELKATGDGKAAFRTDSPLVDEFMQACRGSKDALDALEVAQGQSGSASTYNTELEHFTEACRQNRAFCDDIEMMRDQDPRAA